MATYRLKRKNFAFNLAGQAFKQAGQAFKAGNGIAGIGQAAKGVGRVGLGIGKGAAIAGGIGAAGLYGAEKITD